MIMSTVSMRRTISKVRRKILWAKFNSCPAPSVVVLVTTAEF